MENVLRLDLIIPTFNRCLMLQKALDSVFAAPIPPTMEVMVTVIDNNSSDNTRETVLNYCRKFDGRIRYLFEAQQGKSHALNAGIRAATGDVVGMIDDDEQMDAGWFQAVEPWFQADDVDYIGGPYRPLWEIPPPAWLPSEHSGPIGVFDAVREVRTYGADHPGTLAGGNAVIRRSVFDRVGLYSTDSTTMLGNEDDDMYRRLLSAGARGKYIPELVIYHHIPASRLRKSYFRRWFFKKGIYRAQEQRRWREPVPHFLGVPRYLYGKAVRSSADLFRGAIARNPSRVMSAELIWWNLAGLLYGRHFYKT
jgi:glycosyltransferase involved in cell wall biosynthesis